MFRKLQFLMILGMAVTALAGCETMQGAGRDIENAGEAIQRAVE